MGMISPKTKTSTIAKKTARNSGHMPCKNMGKASEAEVFNKSRVTSSKWRLSCWIKGNTDSASLRSVSSVDARLFMSKTIGSNESSPMVRPEARAAPKTQTKEPIPSIIKPMRECDSALSSLSASLSLYASCRRSCRGRNDDDDSCSRKVDESSHFGKCINSSEEGLQRSVTPANFISIATC